MVTDLVNFIVWIRNLGRERRKVSTDMLTNTTNTKSYYYKRVFYKMSLYPTNDRQNVI